MALRPRRFRPSLVLKTVLVAVTLSAAAALASFPVGTWLDQRSEMSEARTQRDELVGQIDDINAEIEQRLGPDGVAKAAKCFGPYVEPGLEVYSVPGVEGCVTDP